MVKVRALRPLVWVAFLCLVGTAAALHIRWNWQYQAAATPYIHALLQSRNIMPTQAMLPPGPDHWRRAEATRQYVAACGGAVWVVLLVILLISRPRRYLADLLLATAILSIIAWLLIPQMAFPWALPAWAARAQNTAWFRMCCWQPPVGVRLLMLAITVAAVSWIYHKTYVGFPHCAGCGYNLTQCVSEVCPECGMKTAVGHRPAMTKYWPGLGAVTLSVLAGFSLVLWVMVVVFWARSATHWDWLTWHGPGWRIKAHSAGGVAECRLQPGHSGVGLTLGTTHITDVANPRAASWLESQGFMFQAISRPGTPDVTLGAPHWFICLFTSILPILAVRRWIVRRRRPREFDTRKPESNS